MSTIRSFITGNPGNGLISSLFITDTEDTDVIQANPFCPFILTPSEPHTPCPHDLLNVSVESNSCAFLIASITIIFPIDSDSIL